MAEEGIDIARGGPEDPRPPTGRSESDVVITMGCGDACPIFPGKRYEDWELEDPAGQDIEAVRRIRDDIKGASKTWSPSLAFGTAAAEN